MACGLARSPDDISAARAWSKRRGSRWYIASTPTARRILIELPNAQPPSFYPSNLQDVVAIVLVMTRGDRAARSYKFSPGPNQSPLSPCCSLSQLSHSYPRLLTNYSTTGRRSSPWNTPVVDRGTTSHPPSLEWLPADTAEWLE